MPLQWVFEDILDILCRFQNSILLNIRPLTPSFICWLKYLKFRHINIYFGVVLFAFVAHRAPPIFPLYFAKVYVAIKILRKHNNILCGVKKSFLKIWKNLLKYSDISFQNNYNNIEKWKMFVFRITITVLIAISDVLAFLKSLQQYDRLCQDCNYAGFCESGSNKCNCLQQYYRGEKCEYFQNHCNDVKCFGKNRVCTETLGQGYCVCSQDSIDHSECDFIGFYLLKQSLINIQTNWMALFRLQQFAEMQRSKCSVR